MNLEEKTLDNSVVYDGKIIKLVLKDVLLPNGKTAKREVVAHSGGVGVIALTENNEILLVKQFRSPYEKVVTEIPAGKKEAGEDPLECGKRELLEETGFIAKEFCSLGELLPSPGYCGEIIYLFLATGLTKANQNLDEDEFLTFEKVDFDKAVSMVLSGEISDSKTQVAILKTALLKTSGRI